MWRGRTAGEAIPPGTKVRIRGVDGLVLQGRGRAAGSRRRSGPSTVSVEPAAGRGDLVTEPRASRERIPEAVAFEQPDRACRTTSPSRGSTSPPAAARIPRYFFAPSYFERRAEKNAREAVAKAICARCPVRDECLEYALAYAGEPRDLGRHERDGTPGDPAPARPRSRLSRRARPRSIRARMPP